MLERWRDRARATSTQAELGSLQAQLDQWSLGLSRDPSIARPWPDLDKPREWLPEIWRATWSVGDALVGQWSAMRSGTEPDRDVLADPTLSNEALIEQMQRSMARVGF